jgi:hypothetical protein
MGQRLLGAEIDFADRGYIVAVLGKSPAQRRVARVHQSMR